MHIYDDIKRLLYHALNAVVFIVSNKRKNFIRISFVFVFQTFFSTVVFVVILSHIIFIGHVRARVVYYLVIGWWGSLANIPTQINTSNLSMRLVSNIPRNLISLDIFRIYRFFELWKCLMSFLLLVFDEKFTKLVSLNCKVLQNCQEQNIAILYCLLFSCFKIIVIDYFLLCVLSFNSFKPNKSSNFKSIVLLFCSERSKQ